MKLSVVISCYNEEKMIGECLESVKDISDEIIVVDNESTDKTVEVAKSYKAKIFSQPNNIMLNINKNYGFLKATSDLILNLDADERVSTELAQDILKIKSEENELPRSKLTRYPKDSPSASLSLEQSSSDIPLRNKKINGYWIKRKNFIFRKWMKNDMWWPDYQLRLFVRGKGRFDERHVHEYISVVGETEKLNSFIVHYNYRSVNQYLSKLQTIYTENEAKNLIEKGYAFKGADLIRFPARDFLKIFFLQKAYKDGVHGLVVSILQSIYSFIVVVKVWEKEGFREINNQNFLKDLFTEFFKVVHEAQYWFLTCLIDESNNPIKKTYYKLIRRRVRSRLKL